MRAYIAHKYLRLHKSVGCIFMQALKVARMFDRNGDYWQVQRRPNLLQTTPHSGPIEQPTLDHKLTSSSKSKREKNNQINYNNLLHI